MRALCHILLIPFYLLSLLPLPVHHLFADILAFLLRRVFRYRLPVVRGNLQRSFPDLGTKSLRRIERQFYTYLADVFCETVWGLTRSTKWMHRIGMWRVENQQLLDNQYEKGRSVVVYLGHYGNWELLSGICDYSDRPPKFTVDRGVFAYHPMRSRFWEEMFKVIRLSHKKGDSGIVPSSGMLRFVISHRQENWLFFFNSDQSPAPNARYASMFLNQPTLWVTGGEMIARKYGMPVVYLYMDRVGRGRYVVRYSLICEDASRVDEKFIINEYIRLLEKDINSNKANWLWSHRRWKHPVPPEMLAGNRI